MQLAQDMRSACPILKLTAKKRLTEHKVEQEIPEGAKGNEELTKRKLQTLRVYELRAKRKQNCTTLDYQKQKIRLLRLILKNDMNE